MERRALGKGIGALIPDKPAEHKQEIVYVQTGQTLIKTFSFLFLVKLNINRRYYIKK